MQINPPYGFKEIVPLSKNHRVLLPRGRTLPAPFRAMNPMPASYSEFPTASRDYPIIFVSGDAGQTYTAMLVLGVEARQNLFVSQDHTWDTGVYLPAYVRRYPFCMTRMMVDGKESHERLACVEKLAINDKGDPLFDEHGEPLPEWGQRQKLLFDYENDLARTEEMCKLLAQHQLIEPFVMQMAPNKGQSMQLTGMYRVSESKLLALPAEVLRQFAQGGVLGRVYAHLLSLENFNRLAARHAQRGQTAPAPRTSAVRTGKMTVRPEQRAIERRKADAEAAARQRKAAGLPDRRAGGRRGPAARATPKKDG